MSNPLINFIKNVCVQTAVYWSDPVENGYGKKIFASPIEIKVRWENKQKVLKSSDGEEVISQAEILLLQDVNEKGLLYLGHIDDLTSTQQVNPETIEGAKVILVFEKVPLFMSTTEFVRKAYL